MEVNAGILGQKIATINRGADIKNQRQAHTVQAVAGIAGVAGQAMQVEEAKKQADAHAAMLQTELGIHVTPISHLGPAGALEMVKRLGARLEAKRANEAKAAQGATEHGYDVEMQGMRDTAASERNAASDTAATGRQAAGFANETAQRQAATAEQTAMQTALGGQYSELSAPTVSEDAVDAANPDSPSFEPGFGVSGGDMGTPGVDAVNARAARAAAGGKPYDMRAIQQATGTAEKVTPKAARPVDASLVDSRAAQAERDRAAAENLRNPPAKPTKDDSQPIDQADAEQMGVKWRDGMTWGQAKGIAGHRAPASGEGKLSGQNSARATYLREEIGRLQHQIENAYGDTPEEKAAKTDLESLLKDRRAEYDRIAPPVAASPQMPFKGKDAGTPAPADAVAAPEPSAEEMAAIDANPKLKASWLAYTPAQKAAALKAMRGQ